MRHITSVLEFPTHLNKSYAKAIKYEWISLIYMISTTIFSFLVMSNSQTMKTIWLEDMLGIIPPLSFLISSRIVQWKPNNNFPYGFHRVTSMAFLSSSLALFILGVYLLFDGTVVLLTFDHPSIPNVFFFGESIWLGFIMIIALLWSSVPSTFLGHIKLPLAKRLYDKILFADSKMNKASWMSGFASIFGIIGIGLGFWWADALVGIIISFSIIHDGYTNLKQSILDLLDEVPKELGKSTTDPMIHKINHLISKESWIESGEIRCRDEGHVFFCDVFIVPKKEDISIIKIQNLHDKIKKLNWRLNDVVIMPIVNTPY